MELCCSKVNHILTNVLFPPHIICFLFQYWFPLEKSLERYFWIKEKNLDMVLAAYPSMSFGVTVDTGERCYLPLLMLMGPEDSLYFCLSPWKKHLHSVCSSVEWTFLDFLTYLNGSLLTPVTHFSGSGKLQVSFLCLLPLLGTPQEEKQPTVDHGVSVFQLSPLFWLSWTCTLSGRVCSWAA